jgi:alkylated DNA repair protein alkB family protein 6
VIDERYANFLLGEIEAANDRWTILRSRRLQLWGKLPSSHQLPSPQYDQTIPDWLENVINQEISAGIFSEDMRPTNILINQYEADQGIMHHTDGPSYENKVSIISLESPLIMTFKPKLSTEEIGIKSDADVISIVLQPRSLLVFSEELYDVFLHGISADPIHTVGETAPCVNLGICGLNNGDKVRNTRLNHIFDF